MNSINWPASNVRVFIAQLGEHCSANAEATGSNPAEATKNFFAGYFVMGHFTVVCLVTWPLSGSEAGGDLVLIQTFLLFTWKSRCSHAI